MKKILSTGLVLVTAWLWLVNPIGAQKVHRHWQGTPMRISADNTHPREFSPHSPFNISGYTYMSSCSHQYLFIALSSQRLFCTFFLCIFIELLLCFHNCFLCTCTRITKAWRYQIGWMPFKISSDEEKKVGERKRGKKASWNLNFPRTSEHIKPCSWSHQLLYKNNIRLKLCAKRA